MSQFGKSEEQTQWKYSNAENTILDYHRGFAEGLSVSGIAVSKSIYTALTVQSTIFFLPHINRNMATCRDSCWSFLSLFRII
jgi:hypothetical protein